MAVNLREEKDALPINHGEPHLPCVLLVDTSDSMNENDAINELNKGLRLFCDVLNKDTLAMGRVEVCIITFSSTVEITVPFMPAVNFVPPTYNASGLTVMNEAILVALDAIEDRKKVYKEQRIRYYRPWIFLMTDGYATKDDVSCYKRDAVKRIQEYRDKKKINFFPMGIGEGADYLSLKEYAGNGVVLRATEKNFSEAFVWLSGSLSIVSSSEPDEKMRTKDLPRSIEILS